MAKTLASRAAKPNGAPGGGAPFDGRFGNVRVTEPLLEPDPVVAEPFRFAPVLVAGDVWPLLAAEMLVEGLVVQEGRPLTPT